MRAPNYYVILGVSPGESAENIRSAYRRRARELHPDRAGTRSAESFREVREAYETLSDPARRRDYDRRMATRGASRLPRRRDAGGAVDDPEMLVPEPLSLLRHPEGIRPSFEALRDRIMRNFGFFDVPKGEVPEALNFEVLLSPEEAARGGIIPIGLPVLVRCPHCDGTGSTWMFPCLACDQQGWIERERTIAAQLPPMVRHGDVFDYSLEGAGYRNLFLRLHTIIEG